MDEKERIQRIDELIRNVWASLESHLGYTHVEVPPPENNKFHQACCNEYAEMIVKLTRLY